MSATTQWLLMRTVGPACRLTNWFIVELTRDLIETLLHRQTVLKHMAADDPSAGGEPFSLSCQAPTLTPLTNVAAVEELPPDVDEFLDSCEPYLFFVGPPGLDLDLASAIQPYKEVEDYEVKVFPDNFVWRAMIIGSDGIGDVESDIIPRADLVELIKLPPVAGLREYTCFANLESHRSGLVLLTGESDLLGMRILCDFTEKGRRLLAEVFGIPAFRGAEAWNPGRPADPHVGSILLAADYWPVLAVCALMAETQSGVALVATRPAKHGLIVAGGNDAAELQEWTEFMVRDGWSVRTVRSRDGQTRAVHQMSGRRD